MKLTVLGAGTALPVRGHSPSGHLLEIGEERLLFDLGPGTLARLAAAGVSYKELTRVFVSHLHSDHVLDLVTLLQASNATPEWTRERPLELIGCQGLAAFVERITALFDGTAPEGFLDPRDGIGRRATNVRGMGAGDSAHGAHAKQHRLSNRG